MKNRFRQFRAIGRATFPEHQRGLDILGGLSIVMLLGVSLSGIWLFFAHKPDPNWFDYVPDRNFGVARSPSTGISTVHGLFADGAGIVALIGAGWFALRIAHRVPVATVVAFACTVVGAFSGALVRFNLLKMEGTPFEDVGPGYTQVFTRNLEYAVTDTIQIGSGAFRLLTVVHVATVPILLGFGWWSIRRAIDRWTQQLQAPPKRGWRSDSAPD